MFDSGSLPFPDVYQELHKKGKESVLTQSGGCDFYCHTIFCSVFVHLPISPHCHHRHSLSSSFLWAVLGLYPASNWSRIWRLAQVRLLFIIGQVGCYRGYVILYFAYSFLPVSALSWWKKSLFLIWRWSILVVKNIWPKTSFVHFQVDLRHIDEVNDTNVVEVGVDLSEFYTSVEWDILEVPAVR